MKSHKTDLSRLDMIEILNSNGEKVSRKASMERVAKKFVAWKKKKSELEILDGKHNRFAMTKNERNRRRRQRKKNS